MEKCSTTKILGNLMLAALLVVPVSGLAAKQNEAKNNMGTIVPGAVWNDTGGNPINAHGGGLL